MVALIPPSARTGSATQAESRSWFTRLFPFHPRIALYSIAGIWIAYLIFACVQSLHNPGVSIEFFWLHYVGLATVSVIATWILYRMMFIFHSGDILRSLLFLFVLPTPILAFALCQLDRLHAVRLLFFPELFFGFSSLVGGSNVLVPYLLLISWGCIYFALTQNREMETAVNNSRKLQKMTRQSEQRALRYQLNPHFIFNALNSVSSLVVDNKNIQAERLVDELADYLRVVLDDEGQEMVTVTNEISQQVRYLEIEKMRFPDRLCYESSVAPDARNIEIPALIVQPLVENAIKHGVALSKKKVLITIEAVVEKDILKITVSNSGRMTIGKTNLDHMGTGLLNVADRLKVIYGPAAALVTGNNDNGMAVATVIIPNDAPSMQALAPL